MENRNTYVQLSKPFLTANEIDVILAKNVDLKDNLRNFKVKTKETMQILKLVVIKLKIPLKIFQNINYFYQKFYLFNNNYKKYFNLNFEIGLTALFIALKLNDFIKKINLVIYESYLLKGVHLNSFEIDENKKIIVNLERKMLEFQSFDFRNFLIEDFLIKFMKFYKFEQENFNYLSWTILNDLYFTSLVLQYPAHYNAIISIHLSILIFNELNKRKEENSISNIKETDFHEILKNKDNSFILLGCNTILEYLIDNFSSTFLINALNELKFDVDEKKIIDLFINLKIDINSKIQATPKDEISKEDLYFEQRDTEIAKTGSMRFIYNKQKFQDEINLYDQ